MKISCVVPTHKRDEYLIEALESIKKQLLLPAEIIVVDDVGSAATRAVVELHFPDSDIVYIDGSSQASKSAGSSRNLGARHATGTHIAFLDDDDLWKPDFLTGCSNLISSGDADLIVSWAYFLQGDRETPGHSMPKGLSAADAYARNPGLTGSNFLISRRVFLELDGFDPDLWVSNDRDFLIRFLAAGYAYQVLEKRAVLQRVHTTGQLTSRTERRAQGLEAFRYKHISRMTKRDMRFLNRELFSIRRVSADRRSHRVLYLIRQIATYTPMELAKLVARKLQSGQHTYS